MRLLLTLSLFTPLSCANNVSFGQAADHECVVLLHGLARTKWSMVKMEERLDSAGFRVLNRDYPSRHHRIEELTELAIPPAITDCRALGARKIHFVTHSLGGILVRYYLKQHELPELGRVVMLSPPNGGSEVVDNLRENVFFRLMNGPAGQQLGTDDESIPRNLGRVDFELGIITGDWSINPINSMIIPGSDDGKVSVENAKVEGMTDFRVLHTPHPFIMKNDTVIEQAIHFLHNGRFASE